MNALERAFIADNPCPKTLHNTTWKSSPRRTRACRLDSRRLAARSELVGETALAAVLTVLVERHEDTSAALGGRALAAQTLDLAVRVDLIVLQDRHLDLLMLVLDLLRGL